MNATATATIDIALPGILLLALISFIGVETELLRLPTLAPAATGPETVLVAAHPFSYRAGGEFLRGTASIDGPLIEVAPGGPLEIMKYQVSAADYGACVADGACRTAEPRRRGIGNVPATGVSFDDAEDYASWLGRQTGDVWRLPTIEEWAFAAGSRAVDHALGIETDAADPAERWLLAYAKEAALNQDGPVNPMPPGTFGENEFGVADLSAVVWEWTSTCASRTTVDLAGSVLSHIDNCGVHYLEGRHRTPMSNFVDDALGGGCSVGAPPDNLGFRLVREKPWFSQALGVVARALHLG